MNKKLIRTLLGITAGVVMLISTVVASGNPIKGYEVYKNALKNLTTTNDATINFSLDTFDNGNKILGGNFNAKIDLKDKSASVIGKLEANSLSKDFSLFRNSKKEYFQLGTENTIYERPYNKDTDKKHGRKKHVSENNSKKSEMGEKFLDAIMGDFKEKFEVSKSDKDMQTVTFKLSESEIPEALKLLLIARFNNQDNNDNAKSANNPIAQEFLDMGIEEIRPNLVEDITIKEFELQAVIGASGIENQTVTFEVSGKDEKGDFHNLSLTANMTISDINKTSVDKIDLSGKKIIEVDNRR